MSILYINDYGVVVGMSDGRCKATLQEQCIASIPLEQLEGIAILGQAQLTTALTEYCLLNGIVVSYFSRGGTYFGKLESAAHVNVPRQRLQCRLYDTEFALELSRSLIVAKMHNQQVVLKRYEASKNQDCAAEKKMITVSCEKAKKAEDGQSLLGYEGTAARAYFQGMGKCVDEAFYFEKRSRRPPLDPFNSMLSFGYSMLLREIQVSLETHGLNSYFGFFHRDAEKSPSLACDLIEEWRAVIVDATVMSAGNKHIIRRENFEQEDGIPGIYFTKEGVRIFIERMEQKLSTKIQYLPYIDYPLDFRHAIDMQAVQLIKAMEAEDASLYQPLWIR